MTLEGKTVAVVTPKASLIRLKKSLGAHHESISLKPSSGQLILDLVKSSDFTLNHFRADFLHSLSIVLSTAAQW